MKKHIPAAALLLLLIFSLSGCAMFPVRVDEERVSIYEFDGSVKDITVSTTAFDVRIVPSKDGGCIVTCRETNALQHEVKCENGLLSIRLDKKNSGAEVNNKPLEIEISIPSGDYGTVSFETSSGSQDIPAGFSFDDVSLTSSSGGIRMAADARNGIKMTTSSGNQYINRASAPIIEAQSGSGNVNAEELAGVSDLIIDASSGNVILSGVATSESIEIETGSGDVRFSGCDSEYIWIKTGSGDVDGSLLTGKQFRVKTGSGDASFPADAGGEFCEIETGSGDVKITVG